MGGRTAYFGPIGEKVGQDSDIVRTYFEESGAPPCDPASNVAEYMLELVSGDRTQKTDWAQKWTESTTAMDVREEIERINEERSKRPLPIAQDSRAEREFSASLYTQIVETTKRQFVDIYR